jgi:pimeloyl-ACP methyl ester carboxylesterase
MAAPIDAPRDGPGGAALRRYPGPGRATLAADVHGPEDGSTVLLLHGGGQTRHAWGATARRLGEAGWRAIALDMPGHGDSDWLEDGDYSPPAMARAIAEVVRGLGAPIAVVGASLGGLSAMGAIGLPDAPRIDVLVLVDVTPRVESRGVQRIADFMTAHPDGFPSLEDAARHIAAYKGRPVSSSEDGLRKNLRLDASGRWVWHWDPRLMHERSHAQRRDPAVFERSLVGWDRPTLLVRGGRSDVVSPDGARALLAVVPHARYVDLEDAGHMVAGDANDVFTETVVAFLADTLPPSGHPTHPIRSGAPR